MREKYIKVVIVYFNIFFSHYKIDLIAYKVEKRKKTKDKTKKKI